MHLDSADTNQKYTFGYIQTILCFSGVWCSHFGQLFGHAYGTTQLGSELIGHCHIYIERERDRERKVFGLIFDI